VWLRPLLMLKLVLLCGICAATVMGLHVLALIGAVLRLLLLHAACAGPAKSYRYFST
jgi:hypothetical protein